VADPGFAKAGRTMARALCLNGGLGAEPPGDPGAEPLVGVRGRSPPETESFSYLFIQKSGQKLRI